MIWASGERTAMNAAATALGSATARPSSTGRGHTGGSRRTATEGDDGETDGDEDYPTNGGLSVVEHPEAPSGHGDSRPRRSR